MTVINNMIEDKFFLFIGLFLGIGFIYIVFLIKSQSLVDGFIKNWSVSRVSHECFDCILRAVICIQDGFAVKTMICADIHNRFCHLLATREALLFSTIPKGFISWTKNKRQDISYRIMGRF